MYKKNTLTIFSLFLLSLSVIANAKADLPNFFSINSSIKKLEDRADKLNDRIENLPALKDSLQFDEFGYHGGYLPKLDALPEKPRWTVDVSFIHFVRLRQVILVPAMDRRFDNSRSYGFPKRFRILSVFPDGTTSVVKEWMDEDCPDPGRRPLIIDFPEDSACTVRIEVFRGASEGNSELFALDELFGVAPRNVIYGALDVSASSEFESLPYWSKKFLVDQKTGLGLPLGIAENQVSREKSDDFNVIFDSDEERSCVVKLDFGENVSLGWITLFPAVPSEGILIPGYGFPGKIIAEMIYEDGANSRSNPVPQIWNSGNPGNNAISLAGSGKTGRWLRLTMSDFPVHNGRRTFAMGEISVFKKNQRFSIKDISVKGVPENVAPQFGKLIDGISDGAPIMFLLDWLYQIEERNRVESELGETETQISELKNHREKIWAKTALISLISIAGISVLIALISMRNRRKHEHLLRRQINSDLHDDIGSKVAAISLAATFLERNCDLKAAKETGLRIQGIARVMHEGIRDVLWLTDTQTDSAEELIQKLLNCARLTVPPEKLDLKTQIDRETPSFFVNVQKKRDILLFFREAICNAMKHSKSEKIEICIQLNGRKLLIRVVDNGCGFVLPKDGFNDSFHHGLLTMNERSKKLSGTLQIDSKIDVGTSIELNVSL